MNNIQKAGKCIIWHVYIFIATCINLIVNYIRIKEAHRVEDIEDITAQMIVITIILLGIQLFMLYRAGRHLMNSEIAEIDENVDTDEILTSRERLNRMIQNPE